MWRWDQGRLLYFQFDVLRKIAKVLVDFDNKDITQCKALFRDTLVKETGMPFLPDQYTIKRNYSRVFQCSFLANFEKNKLIVTDICKDLAEVDGAQKSVDDYLFNYISRFRFPFPAFDNYNTKEQRVYPFCAILKFLLSRIELGLEAKVSLDDIFKYIIANDCTGREGIRYYKNLSEKNYAYTKTERRQLREMVYFVSQLSILKVYKDSLYLDALNENARKELLNVFLKPKYRVPKNNRIKEFYEMTSISQKQKIIIPTFEVFTADPADIEFLEAGFTIQVQH